jgi:hypothetical protein
MSTLTTLTSVITEGAYARGFGGGPHPGEIGETDYRSRRAVLREKE